MALALSSVRALGRRLALPSLVLGLTACEAGPLSPTALRDVRIDPVVLDLEIGETATPRLETVPWPGGRPVTGADTPVRWQIRDAAIASVISPSGQVRGEGEGETVLQADVGGATGTAIVRVARRPVGSLRVPLLATLSDSLQGPIVGTAVEMPAEVRDTAGRLLPTRPVRWQLEGDTTIACLVGLASDPAPDAQRCMTTRVSPLRLRAGSVLGTVRLTASVSGAQQTWTVRVRPVPATTLRWRDLAPTAPSVTVEEGKTYALVIEARTADGTVVTRQPVWQVADTMVARVSATGVLVGRRAGRTQVTAALDGQQLTASVQVVPVVAAQVVVTPETVSLRQGEGIQMESAVLDAEGARLEDRVVTWHTLTPSVVSITTSGRLTAYRPGVGQVEARHVQVGTGALLRTVVPVEVAARSRGGDLSVVDARWVQTTTPVAGGSTPLVAQRDAALLVRLSGQGVVAANASSARLELRVMTASGVVIHRDTIRPRRPLPETATALSDAPQEILRIPGAVLAAGQGLTWEIVRDPDGTWPDDDRANDRFPRGGPQPLDVRAMRPLRVVLVPVRLEAHGGRQSVVNATEYAAQASLAQQLIPASSWEPPVMWTTPVVVRSAVLEWTVTEGQDSVLVLPEAAWVAVYEGMTQVRQNGVLQRPDLRDAHWVAVIDPPLQTSRSALDGLAEVDGRISVVLASSAVTSARLATSSLGLAKTFAHELLHNFGRLHSPCGNPASLVDPAFPDAEGRIQGLGVAVWDSSLGLPRLWSSTTPDVMGYCETPGWLHPSHWGPLLTARAAAGSAAARAMAAGGTPVPVLSWWIDGAGRPAAHGPQWGGAGAGARTRSAWRLEVQTATGAVTSRALEEERLDHVRGRRLVLSAPDLAGAPATVRLVSPTGQPSAWVTLQPRGEP